jgi:hypothetical protein
VSTPRTVVLERTFYTLAAPVLAAAPNLPDHFPPGGAAHTVAVLANGAVTVGGLGAPFWVAAKSHEGTGRKLMRLSPLVLAAAIEVASHAVPDWGTIAMTALWAGLGCFVLPLSRTGRRRFRPPASAVLPPQPQVGQPEPAPVVLDDGVDDFTRGVRFLWERAGQSGRTTVVKVIRVPGMPHDMTMLLCSAEPGRPITGITAAMVAAAFGISEDDVAFAPVARQDGSRQSGPGWLEVVLTPDESRRRRTDPTDQEWWADKVATTAIPGSVFVRKVRNKERGVTYWVGRMPDAMGTPRVNPTDLCQALKVSYDDGLVFTTVAGPDVLVTQWDVSPLAREYPASRELLTPDAEGRWVVGYLTNGQPARNRIYTDRGAAHGLLVSPSGGGKTQLMSLFICADANGGVVVWLASQAPDEKTTALGPHVDRQGTGELYMLRAMRAALALMEIRSQMPWADGRVHDWEPGIPGCPYSPLSVYWDEFLMAAREKEIGYGAEIMRGAEDISILGRKYAIGEKIAGQSIYVQDGFSSLLCENLRDNCIPVVLRVAPKKLAEMFRTLAVSSEDTPDPLPRSFSPEDAGRIDRIMNGEVEPAGSSNTGGVGWIVPGRKPEVLRTLLMNYKTGIDHLFPEQVNRLTDHEIAELEKRDLWFDWQNEPMRPGEFWPEDEADDQDDLDDGAPKGKPRGGGGKPKPKAQRMSEVATPRQALDAIKKLSGV